MVALKNGVVLLPLKFEDLEYKPEPKFNNFDTQLKGLLKVPPPRDDK